LLLVLFALFLLLFAFVFDVVPIKGHVLGHRFLVVGGHWILYFFKDLVDALDAADFEFEVPVALAGLNDHLLVGLGLSRPAILISVTRDRYLLPIFGNVDLPHLDPISLGQAVVRVNTRLIVCQEVAGHLIVSLVPQPCLLRFKIWNWGVPK